MHFTRIHDLDTQSRLCTTQNSSFYLGFSRINSKDCYKCETMNSKQNRITILKEILDNKEIFRAFSDKLTIEDANEWSKIHVKT